MEESWRIRIQHPQQWRQVGETGNQLLSRWPWQRINQCRGRGLFIINSVDVVDVNGMRPLTDFFIPMTNNVYTHCHTRHVWITDGLTNGLISETWRRWSCNWMSLAYSMSSAIQISKSFLRNRWSGWEAFFICFAFFADGRQAAGGERGAGPVPTRFARRPSFVCRMCGRTHGAIYSLSSMCRVLTVTWLCVKCFGKQECRYVANVVFPPSLWPDLELNSK